MRCLRWCVRAKRHAVDSYSQSILRSGEARIVGHVRQRPALRHDDVSPEVFDAFQAAPSRGAFFNQEIRDRYTFREKPRR
jgi:KTSC domain